MSLKQFLVVGKSFADVPEGKSPFEMRPEARLPRFEAEPRFTSRPSVPVQADWLAENSHRPVEPQGEVKQRNQVKRARPRRSWLDILTFGFLGKEKVQGKMVQDEMLLDNVRVLRNDLADSDLEVVVKKNQKFALRAVKAGAPAQIQAERGPSAPQMNGTPDEPTIDTVVTAPRKEEENSRGEECPRAALRKKPKRFEWTELTVRLFEIGQH